MFYVYVCRYIGYNGVTSLADAMGLQMGEWVVGKQERGWTGGWSLHSIHLLHIQLPSFPFYILQR